MRTRSAAFLAPSFSMMRARCTSMVRGEKHAPGQAWRSESEWFGGPRGGLEAADKVDPKAIEGHDEADRGGASVRW